MWFSLTSIETAIIYSILFEKIAKFYYAGAVKNFISNKDVNILSKVIFFDRQ